jgi:hypothetical protein
MKQREVRDKENVRWTCMEALGSIGEGLTSDNNGNVTVVCTPSGGSQTVRIKLESDWFENTSDENPLEQIARSKN